MKVARFAYQIRITQFCLAIFQCVLVVGLGLFCMITPFIFSTNTPLKYYSKTCEIENITPEIQISKKTYPSKTSMWKQMNVSVTENGKKAFSIINFCYSEGSVSEIIESNVNACFKDIEGILTIGKSVEGLIQFGTSFKDGMKLKSEVYSYFSTEILFALLLAVGYLIISLIYGFFTIIYVEVRWKKFFTLIRNKQLPKAILSSSTEEEQEPFIVKQANYDKFGRMSMQKGTLICPKFEENEKVVSKYELKISPSLKTNERNGNNLEAFKPNKGFWKVMGASSKWKKESIEYFYKLPLKKALFSRRGITSIIGIPISIIAMILLMILFLFLFNDWFSEVFVSVPPITVIGSLIALYSIEALFEIVAGIIQISSEHVIITDTRIIFLWIERFNHRIEYLFFDDILDVQLKTINNSDKPTIKCKISTILIEKFKSLYPRRAHQIDESQQYHSNPISSYLMYLEKEEAETVVQMIKDLKEKMIDKDDNSDISDDDNDLTLNERNEDDDRIGNDQFFSLTDQPELDMNEYELKEKVEGKKKEEEIKEQQQNDTKV